MKRVLVALAVTGAFAIGACSHGDRSPSVSIVATDDGYVAPDTIPEGLNHIVFENHGSTIHECMFVRLPDGMSAAEYVDSVAAGYNFPPGAIDCSGSGLTSPLERVELWIPLEAGRYLLACWFRGHLEHTTPHTLVVHGAQETPVVPPREDVTLKLIDFRYEMIGHVKLGMQTIRVETVGPSMHEVDCFRMEATYKRDDLAAWYANHMDGSPHATALGGVLDKHDLSSPVWMRRGFTVGHYVLWCDMPMIQKGKKSDAGSAAHATHGEAGMVMEFDVSVSP